MKRRVRCCTKIITRTMREAKADDDAASCCDRIALGQTPQLSAASLDGTAAPLPLPAHLFPTGRLHRALPGGGPLGRDTATYAQAILIGRAKLPG
jgi:hypothetical protein